jgi:hypothetical protein
MFSICTGLAGGLRTAIGAVGSRTAAFRTAAFRTAIAACAWGALAATSSYAAPLGSAQAPGTPTLVSPPTTATITPILSPDRLRAEGSLTVTIHYAGGPFGVPSPIRKAVLELPAGLNLEIPSLHSCGAGRLLARGPTACPARSKLGAGRALAEVHAGTVTISENASLWVFLGPLQSNLEPTFEILAQGYTPVDERMVLRGTVLPANAPYGEELELAIPPIPTLMFEPDASIVDFSLTIGGTGRRASRGANTILVPSSCPAGGFPFAAEFTYAEGSTGIALATVPCP